MPYKDFDKRRECHRRSDGKRRALGLVKPRPPRLGIAPRSQTAPYVAIDSEGWDLGEVKQFRIYDPLAEKSLRLKARPHRVFLFGACAEEGEPVFLDCAAGRSHLSSLEILNWLLDLPRQFPGAIFVMFGARYDWVHAIKDVPFERALHMQKAQYVRGVRQAPATSFSLGADRFAVRMMPGKSFTLMQLGTVAEARAQRSRWNGAGWPWVRRIHIHDTFATWNTGQYDAASKMEGAISCDRERRILEQGKDVLRKHFKPGQEADAKRYQEVELRVLCRMTRLTYRVACGALGLKVQRPEGAGPIGAAIMTKHDVKAHCLKVSTGYDADGNRVPIPEWQLWAERAASGGRIDLMCQGYTDEPVYEYDRRSAYPAEIAQLISQAGGKFKTWILPHRDRADARTRRKLLSRLDACSPLSMVRLSAYHRGAPLYPTTFADPEVRARIPPFYPFFYRSEEGRIFYPPVVRGIYMIEEVKFACRWVQKFGYEDEYSIEVEALHEFIPGKGDVLPFADWMNEYYELKERYKKSGNVLGQTVKNGICAIYGKFAQARSRSPAFADPLYAAAITAGMRAKLGDAALLDPSAIISFATDALVSKRPLALDCSERLGAWECKSPPEGDTPSMFIIPGMYEIADRVSRNRGFKINREEMRHLFADVLDNWREGRGGPVSVPYQYLMTLGLATAAEQNWPYAGYWIEGRRVLNCQLAGQKREAALDGKARASRLVKVEPKALELRVPPWRMELSAPIRPDWQDEDAALDGLSEIEAAYYAAIYR